MHLIDQREKTMKPDDKIRLEIGRTVLATLGHNLREKMANYNLRTGASRAMKIAESIMKRFNVEFKDPKEMKIFWPEDDVAWDGKNAERIHEEKEPSIDLVEKPKDEEKKEEEKPTRNNSRSGKVNDEPKDK